MSKKKDRSSQSAAEQQKSPKRDLLIGLAALVVVVAVSFGLLSYINWAQSRPVGDDGIVSPVGEQPIELTLVHTNDTWGYLDPCG
jgi:2',3'-cyclic-nucleotide 2'-phosphodiesterase (5'-nucleotidase family)